MWLRPDISNDLSFKEDRTHVPFPSRAFPPHSPLQCGQVPIPPPKPPMPCPIPNGGGLMLKSIPRLYGKQHEGETVNGTLTAGSKSLGEEV